MLKKNLKNQSLYVVLPKLVKIKDIIHYLILNAYKTFEKSITSH